MKARPRRIEREVAEHLSRIFERYGFSPVERIPVLGRTGPDISINELGLVIDVKSRQSVPACFRFNRIADGYKGNPISVHAGKYMAANLLDFPQVAFYYDKVFKRTVSSVTVDKWYDHMDEWRLENMPDGISALVLHYPGSRIGNATFLIHQNDRRRLYEKWNKIQKMT